MAESETPTASGGVPRTAPAERCFWHVKTWAMLTRDLGKLPHALLLHGPEGLGKRIFAWRLAQSVLCTRPEADAAACGSCHSCRLFAAGTHPDLLSVAPLGDSISIVIDQIRDVRQFVELRPHTSARKLVLLEPADAMNLSAANALLKVLEEPPATSALLLITPQAARLPATIRSRCTPVTFIPPAALNAVRWLAEHGVDEATGAAMLRLAGGAPLRALAFAGADEQAERAEWLKDVERLKTEQEDPLRCVARWRGYGVGRCLDWFQRYVADLIEAEMVNGVSRKNPRLVSDLFRHFDVLSEAKSLSKGALDETLLLEDILIGWSRLFRPVV
jgi:DNA polymerase-3 subunit delta'